MNRKNPIRNKLAAALLALLMAVGMLPMPALAVTANSMSLEVGHVTALITDTEVKVPISATVNTGYGAGIITVEWDKSKLEEVTETGLRVSGPEGEYELPADTVICAAGQRPLREEALALRDCAPEFHMLGDCVTPKNVMAATQAAFQIARDIGR